MYSSIFLNLRNDICASSLNSRSASHTFANYENVITKFPSESYCDVLWNMSMHCSYENRLGSTNLNIKKNSKNSNVLFPSRSLASNISVIESRTFPISILYCSSAKFIASSISIMKGLCFFGSGILIFSIPLISSVYRFYAKLVLPFHKNACLNASIILA